MADSATKGVSGPIIHTEASLGWGGQEIRTLTECRWMREQGFRCMLAAPADSPISKKFQEDGFEVLPISFTKASQLGDFARCFRAFRALKPAMVGTHSNIDSRVALAAAAAAGVPRRIRYRHVSIPVSVSPWNRFIYRRLATGVITTASAITTTLEKDFNLPPGHVTTIGTGVASTSLDDVAEASVNVRRGLGLAEDAKIVTQVSVLRQWKGHEFLMKAFDRLAAADPRLHLVLVGGGPGLVYLPPQAAQLASHARIHFAGHQADPYPFFKAADVVVLASTGGEGIPQSVLQAFACGRAFVGTTVGGIPDIVTHGQNGLLVPPENVDALAEAIGSVLADGALAERLSVNARRFSDDYGSVEHMGRRLREFLKL